MERGVRNKRGQFYIIAAVIIISIILGLVVLRNYIKTEEGSKIYDLSKELKIETGYVYDYGIYNQANTSSLTEDWTEKYYEYSRAQGAVEDWIFVYGNNKELTAITFTVVSSGSVGVITGGKTTEVEIKTKSKTIHRDIIPEKGGEVKIKFKGFEYPFKLKEGENFFFVIKAKGYVAEG